MQSAEYDRNTILISSKDEGIKFRASGSILKFDGFINSPVMVFALAFCLSASDISRTSCFFVSF